MVQRAHIADEELAKLVPERQQGEPPQRPATDLLDGGPLVFRIEELEVLGVVWIKPILVREEEGLAACPSSHRRMLRTRSAGAGRMSRPPKLDLNGDGAWGATNEHNDTRTYDDANELTARDVDTSGGNDYT